MYTLQIKITSLEVCKIRDITSCYKPEGAVSMLRPQYDPMVDSASGRNDNQGYLLVGERGRCIGPTTLPPSCADRLEILGSHPLGATRTLEAVISTNVGEKLLLEV
jgi:hypothetical protein